MKIKAKDVKIFLLGMFTLFVINTIMNWDEAKESFMRGFNESYDAIGMNQNNQTKKLL
ncbi:MAG: hypothetical protein JKY08_10210 [Flavobacteriaceae bacterium]|nr:hypothetical protein [Flavobacteriaceae bacterium]